MFAIGTATRIYVATGATDMRKSFNGLAGLVRERLGSDPTSGHVFLFANARRDRMKCLFFDGSGLWVCAKRIERGRLRWPESDGGKVQLSREEFALLIGRSVGVTKRRINTADFFAYPQQNLVSKKA